jgi:hypothetical protein
MPILQEGVCLRASNIGRGVWLRAFRRDDSFGCGAPSPREVRGEGEIAATLQLQLISPYSTLTLAALMIGHHFAISAFCQVPSASGVS